MNKKIIFIRLAAVFAVLGMLLPLLICSPAAEKAGASPSDGVFRLRSASTGQYLTAYLNGSRGYGKAYIAPLDSTVLRSGRKMIRHFTALRIRKARLRDLP